MKAGSPSVSLLGKWIFSLSQSNAYLSLVILTLRFTTVLPKDANVGPVVFDYGIKICQKTKRAKCTLELGPQQYSDPIVNRGTKAFDPVRVVFKCTGPHQRRLEGAEDAALELPLAKMCGDSLAFKYIRLSVFSRKVKRSHAATAGNVNVLVGQLKTFLTGHTTLVVTSELSRSVSVHAIGAT